MASSDWRTYEEPSHDFEPYRDGAYDYGTSGPGVATFDFADEGGRRWGSDEYIPTSVTDADEYEGPYTAEALFSPQTFDTARKLMRADFAVRAINYTEAPNDFGTTVVIGG